MRPPPKHTINAPAQTIHLKEPRFCMDTPLGTTAGYSGAIFRIRPPSRSVCGTPKSKNRENFFFHFFHFFTKYGWFDVLTTRKNDQKHFKCVNKVWIIFFKSVSQITIFEVFGWDRGWARSRFSSLLSAAGIESAILRCERQAAASLPLNYA